MSGTQRRIILTACRRPDINRTHSTSGNHLWLVQPDGCYRPGCTVQSETSVVVKMLWTYSSSFFIVLLLELGLVGFSRVSVMVRFQ